MNAVEIYQFPPLNLSPLAINFYSVTKNRLMARMSLPPTHRVQWEDEPGGEGGGEITSKKRKKGRQREQRLVSFRRSLLPVWLFAKEVGGEMQEYIIRRNALTRARLWQLQ